MTRFFLTSPAINKHNFHKSWAFKEQVLQYDIQLSLNKGNIPADICIRAGWSESSLFICRNFASLNIQTASNEDSDKDAQDYLNVRMGYMSDGTFPMLRFSFVFSFIQASCSFVFIKQYLVNESTHDKTNNKTFVTSKLSDQPVYPPYMARVLVYPSLDSLKTIKGMCRQIWVFADCTSLIICFVVRWLKCIMKLFKQGSLCEKKKKQQQQTIKKQQRERWTCAGLGGSVGCAVRLGTRRSRVQPPPRSATLFRGDWSWNIFYGHSPSSADSRRAVVSFWRKNVHTTG